jgi:Mg-chelatase subunit ChlD
MTNNKDLSVFVALDRSGSMTGEKWTNAVDSLNEYVKGLQKEKISGDITIIAFDSDGMYGGNSSVRLVPLAEAADIAYFDRIDASSLYPAGGTPLYDAAGHVINLALEKNSKRTVVVILTDGDENTSKEYTQAKIKEKVAEVTAKGWEVIFLGANFDATRYNAGSGLAAGKLRNFDLNNEVQRKAMYTDLATSTASYASVGAAINLSE